MTVVNDNVVRERARTRTEAEQSIAYEVLRHVEQDDLDPVAAGRLVARTYGIPLSVVFDYYETHFDWAQHHWTARHSS